MKKISIIVTSMVLLVAVAGTMQAGAQLSAGVKAGLNLASFDADFEKLRDKTRAGCRWFRCISIQFKMVGPGRSIILDAGNQNKLRKLRF
ncbi:MAG: hypothetical protein NVV59_04845 [Chitinophagaceae bacterium]|nr:hypothetical protein [Chitinophagaceae bacterium]